MIDCDGKNNFKDGIGEKAEGLFGLFISWAIIWIQFFPARSAQIAQHFDVAKGDPLNSNEPGTNKSGSIYKHKIRHEIQCAAKHLFNLGRAQALRVQSQVL